MSIKSVLKSRIKSFKLSHPKLASYHRRFPFEGDSGVHIAVVGSERYGLRGQGKTKPDRYFPKFEYGAIKAGATVAFYQTPSLLMRSLHVHDDRPLAIIFLYNEERLEDYPPDATMRILEQRPRTIVYNSPAVARKIAEKSVTNRILTNAAIDVPRMSSRAESPLFSNTNTGSHQPTKIITQGSIVDLARYNTELIDTCVEVDGHEYYVSLRAICVAGRILDLFVRCRPIEDGTPNVHSSDTPLDPDLLNTINSQHVQPRMDDIQNLCRNLGETLGPALFVHDILLSSDGRLPVCEVGFKFDDTTLVEHLWPVSSGLDFMRKAFSYQHAEEVAQVVVESVQNERIYA